MMNKRNYNNIFTVFFYENRACKIENKDLSDIISDITIFNSYVILQFLKYKHFNKSIGSILENISCIVCTIQDRVGNPYKQYVFDNIKILQITHDIYSYDSNIDTEKDTITSVIINY